MIANLGFPLFFPYKPRQISVYGVSLKIKYRSCILLFAKDFFFIEIMWFLSFHNFCFYYIFIICLFYSIHNILYDAIYNFCEYFLAIFIFSFFFFTNIFLFPLNYFEKQLFAHIHVNKATPGEKSIT